MNKPDRLTATLNAAAALPPAAVRFLGCTAPVPDDGRAIVARYGPNEICNELSVGNWEISFPLLSGALPYLEGPLQSLTPHNWRQLVELILDPRVVLHFAPELGEDAALALVELTGGPDRAAYLAGYGSGLRHGARSAFDGAERVLTDLLAKRDAQTAPAGPAVEVRRVAYDGITLVTVEADGYSVAWPADKPDCLTVDLGAGPGEETIAGLAALRALLNAPEIAALLATVKPAAE